MPVSVVVGGQFGSEGKGKIAYETARRLRAAAAVRVGGPNSGHTAIDSSGNRVVLRQLPTAAILPKSLCIIPAGSYIDLAVFEDELERLGLCNDRVVVDPNAILVTEKEREAEKTVGLQQSIGSTLSGTGAAILNRVKRDGSAVFASSVERLQPFVKQTRPLLRSLLNANERVVIEGTQGFGLSLFHSKYYPKVTSRDTSAAAFVSEAGLSPIDIDDVVLVIRAFPIRVAGNSGLLPKETTWESIAANSGYEAGLVEHTSVTGNVRRVAQFDAAVVNAAIEANNPTTLVLNHLDYVDASCRTTGALTARAANFLDVVQGQITKKVDYFGVSPSSMIALGDVGSEELSA